MSVIPGFTDIRPVGLLQPVYGIFFGIPGCVAFAVGNLIGDIVSDSLRWSSIAGFAANFMGPFLYYLLLCRLAKEPFSLRGGKSLLKMTAVTAASAIAQAAMITPMVKLVYPEVSGTVFATSVLLNDSVFPLMLGIPLIILMQEELGFRPQANRIRPES
jgi:energy-coupling factor transport system substrate-specific component